MTQEEQKHIDDLEQAYGTLSEEHEYVCEEFSSRVRGDLANIKERLHVIARLYSEHYKGAVREEMLSGLVEAEKALGRVLQLHQ